MNNTRNGCDMARVIGSEMCYKCMSPEEIEAERRAEDMAQAEMERGICIAECDYEEDSEYRLRTCPG